MVSNHVAMIHNRTSVQTFKRIDTTAITFVMLMITLTLLMINMVVPTPHHHYGPSLPKVAHPTAMRSADREDALMVLVARDGLIYLGNDRTDKTLMVHDLKIRLSQGAEPKLYIQADALARYSYVSTVLDAASSAGIYQIAFMVDERKDAPTIFQ